MLAYLHYMRDGLALGEDLREVFGSEDVSKGGGGQQASGVTVVLHVCDGDCGIADAVVYDSVYSHRHGVL